MSSKRLSKNIRMSFKVHLIDKLIRTNSILKKKHNETPSTPSIAINSQDISHKLVQDAEFASGSVKQTSWG